MIPRTPRTFLGQGTVSPVSRDILDLGKVELPEWNVFMMILYVAKAVLALPHATDEVAVVVTLACVLQVLAVGVYRLRADIKGKPGDFHGYDTIEIRPNQP
jgi:hypothetical protein